MGISAPCPAGFLKIPRSSYEASAVAEATGGAAGIPTIAFDLPTMKSSLVGASSERLRTALKIIDAVSQGRMLFAATCNSIARLPPELRRRFTLGRFFFDLPTAEEREAILADLPQEVWRVGPLAQRRGLDEPTKTEHHLQPTGLIAQP